MNKFEKIYKKVLDADKKFKELGIPINLDFKIEDLDIVLVFFVVATLKNAIQKDLVKSATSISICGEKQNKNGEIKDL